MSCSTSPWPTTRILVALAGTMTLLGVALAVTISPWLLVLPAFVGGNQVLFVIAGACPASLLIDRLRRDTALGTVSPYREEH